MTIPPPSNNCPYGASRLHHFAPTWAFFKTILPCGFLVLDSQGQGVDYSSFQLGTSVIYYFPYFEP